MSIIKRVTLQKIVAHDFRYDSRILLCKRLMIRGVQNLKCEVNKVIMKHYHKHPSELMRSVIGQLCILMKSSLESQTECVGCVDEVSRQYCFLSCNHIY